MARARGTAARPGRSWPCSCPPEPPTSTRDVRADPAARTASRATVPSGRRACCGWTAAARCARAGMSGEVVVPGRSGDSLLIQHLTGRATPRMPHEKPALDPALVAPHRGLDRRRRDGAGRRCRAGGDRSATGPTGSRAARRCPPSRDAAWVRSPIDAFVLARLEQEGLAPSPEASRETLVRRLSLDLVGLPPSPAEAGRVPGDPSPGAYAALVERLLASPRYGERWARPWLDLARYADTNGYEKDQRRTRLEVPRLGDRRAQPRPVVPRLHDRAARRRHAAGRDASSSGSPPASTATPSSTRRAASTSRSSASRRSSTA